MPAADLRIELLGGLRITPASGAPVELPSRQAGAVFAYLALHLRRKHGREELVDLFWPDDDVEEGRGKLRKALHTIREWLLQTGIDPNRCLLASRSEIRLDTAQVVTDVGEIEQALAAAARSKDSSDRLRLLSDAVGLFRGELLPGFYDECFAAERHRLAAAHESALHDLIGSCEQLGELERGLEIALRAVAMSPTSEDARCAAMRLFAARGQPDAVIRQYRELERALEAELGEKPCENTHMLMQSLAQSGCETRTARELIPARPAALPAQTPPISEASHAPTRKGEHVDSAPVRRGRRAWIVTLAAASVVCAVFLWNPRPKPPPTVTTLPVAVLPAVVWRESYGPNEERIGREVQGRWPEIEREAGRLRSRPAALTAFAARLWRIAFTLGKGREVGAWLKEALDSNAPMEPADEALAAANVAFQLSMDTEEPTESIPHFHVIPYAKRAHEAAVRSGDRWLIAHSLRALGASEALGREPYYKIYRAHYAESYRIFHELGDERGMALVETCYASGFIGESIGEVFQDRYRDSATRSGKAYIRWQKIGNSWGMGFTARLLQEQMALLERPPAGPERSTYADICSLALGVIAAERIRQTAEGRFTDAGKLLATQSLVRMDQDRTDDAVRDLKEALSREFSNDNLKLVGDRLEEYTRSRGSEAARRRLREALRSIALH